MSIYQKAAKIRLIEKIILEIKEGMMFDILLEHNNSKKNDKQTSRCLPRYDLQGYDEIQIMFSLIEFIMAQEFDLEQKSAALNSTGLVAKVSSGNEVIDVAFKREENINNGFDIELEFMDY